MPYRGVAPSFIYKIDHRFPKTGDFKSSRKKYTLESEITKLIVYSYCETKLNIVLWRMSPDKEIIKITEPWEIKPKMNVICLCRYRMTRTGQLFLMDMLLLVAAILFRRELVEGNCEQ